MFNVKAEFERTPIRHIAVQCPHCQKWFHGLDIVKGKDPLEELRYKEYIAWAVFKCPVCNQEFGGIQNRDKPNIEETAYPDVYEGCLEKKVVFE